jgi:hypothetical protein
MVRQRSPDLPILLQTRDPAAAERAREQGNHVLLKDSPVLLEDLSRFIRDSFGFGDFVFRNPRWRRGRARARPCASSRRCCPPSPSRPCATTAERNHFSTWLRARTEFSLAEALRERRVSEFASVDSMRRYLIDVIREFRRDRQSGVISEFDPVELRDPRPRSRRSGRDRSAARRAGSRSCGS